MLAPRTRLRPFAALIAALALLLAGLVVASPAQAVDNASISGTIYTSDDDPLEGAGATVLKVLEGGGFATGGSAAANEDGEYTVGGLAAGEYIVIFSNIGYAPQYFDDAPSYGLSTTVTLTAGQTRGGVSATLEHAATLSGTISKEGGGTEENLAVQAMQLQPGGSFEQVGFAYTVSDGSYSIGELPSGVYTLQINGGASDYPLQYLGGGTTSAGASRVDVSEGENQTGFNGIVKLAPAAGASVLGTITKTSGAPLSNAWASAYRFDATDGWVFADDAITDGDGDYTLTDLEPGTYRFGFERPGYRDAYWNDTEFGARTIELGTSVTLTDQTETGVGVALAESSESVASISGTVSVQGGGSPLDVEVELIDMATGDSLDDRSLEADGAYSFDAVPAGTYTLELHRDAGSRPAVPYQYRGGYIDLANAQTFTLGSLDPDEQKTGVNATVTLGGVVTGTVRTPANAPLRDVQVGLYARLTGGSAPAWVQVDGGTTSTNGTYSFAGVVGGSFTVGFKAAGYPDQFLGGVSTKANATSFALAPGDPKFNVDQSLRTSETIDKSITTATLSLSPAARAFGAASTATVQLTGGNPNGSTVVLKEGATTVGTGTFAGGTATVALPKTLSVGTHTLVATYGGSSTMVPATSAAQTLTVVKAKATVGAKLAKKSIKKKAKGKVTVTVSAAGLVPTGSVVVKDGSKTLKTVSLKNGKVTVTLPKLKKGKHKLTVTYKGSGTVDAATSKSVTLKVS